MIQAYASLGGGDRAKDEKLTNPLTTAVEIRNIAIQTGLTVYVFVPILSKSCRSANSFFQGDREGGRGIKEGEG